MSDDQSDQPETMIEVLGVRRNTTIGLAVGLIVGILAYVVRVFELLGPVATGREYPVIGPEGWFLLLAVVFAAATALLVTLVLTAVAVAKLARTVD